MQKLRISKALLSQAMQIAAQSMLLEQHLVACGTRRSLFTASSRLLSARVVSSYGANTTWSRAPVCSVADSAARSSSGRLSFCSQLVVKHGGRKISTRVSAVWHCWTISSVLCDQGRTMREGCAKFCLGKTCPLCFVVLRAGMLHACDGYLNSMVWRTEPASILVSSVVAAWQLLASK